MGLRLALGLARGRGNSEPPIITADTAPTLGALAEGDTPSTGFTSGTYSSTAGTISTETAEASINGGAFSAAAMSTSLSGGDTVSVREVVVDSAANTRTFSAGTETVSGGATGIGTWVVGSTFTIAA